MIDSACVIAAVQSAKGLRVLLAQRGTGASLAPGHWVFPGGVVEPGDRAGVDKGTAFERAALRELAEEVGHGAALAPPLMCVGQWTTPAHFAKRYCTRFYFLCGPRFEPRCDGVEITDARWIAPAAGVQAQAVGQMPMMFPTVALLHWLAGFDTVAAVSRALNEQALKPVCPELVRVGDRSYLCIDPEAGYGLQRWAVDSA